MRHDLLLCGVATLAVAGASAAAPLALHPDNPHYFLWRTRPMAIVTSGEHYGAVLNLDFDFRKYLDTLSKDGLNCTRTFSGVYCEPVGAFNIDRNTLAPAAGRLITPWARSPFPGYANGGNKFDLTIWDANYFKRLKDFLAYAAKQDVIVELNLFCPFYEEAMWSLSPMNAINNVNGVGAVARTNVYTLDRSGELLGVQEELVRKIVTEVNGFDNLYFEICNEPYFGGVTLDWQQRIATVISDTEKYLPARHLISQNIANGEARVEHPHPAVSILNFHYAYPPATVAMNYGLNRVIGDNETGFRGTNNLPYRVEGWSFLMAGGGLFNNLDYSFVVGHENGSYVYPAGSPGGGNPVFRREMKILSDFLRRLDLVRMKPDASVIAGGVPPAHRAYALVQPGQVWVAYLAQDPQDKNAPAGPHATTLQLALPAGRFDAEWLNPRTGKVDKRERLKHAGGTAALASPTFVEDVALRVTRR